MSVQLQQFRVVGVNRETGEDVSVVIDAATKAAAEVKAEKMDIETTHIVRLKAEEPVPPDEHELFSSEAAEALAGKRTINLIEECVPPEEPKQTVESATPPPTPAPEPHKVVAAITRPNYAAPNNGREAVGANISGVRVFSFMLLLLLGMTAGAYFVLIHEPNKVQAEQNQLIFGEDLFSDVIGHDAADKRDAALREAINKPGQARADTDNEPIAKDQQIHINPRPTPAPPTPTTSAAPALVLQSVVTSHEGRFAVINGKFYKEGAELAGCKLVSVADDWVLMERLGEQFTLEIQANPAN